MERREEPPPMAHACKSTCRMPASTRLAVSSSPVPAAVLAPRRIRIGAATSTRSAASRSGPSLPAPAARLHLREGAPPRAAAGPARLHTHPWLAAGPARPPPTRAATGPAALLPHSSGGAPSGLRRHDSTCARTRLFRRRQGRCARLPRAQRRDWRRSGCGGGGGSVGGAGSKQRSSPV